MSRRMMSSRTIIKSQIVDDKDQVDLNDILEKYGTVIFDGSGKTITLQIYNRAAADDGSLNDIQNIGLVVMNGSITITKYPDGSVYIQGMLFDHNNDFIPYLVIPSGSYGNGIMLGSSDKFDLYVIKV